MCFAHRWEKEATAQTQAQISSGSCCLFFALLLPRLFITPQPPNPQNRSSRIKYTTELKLFQLWKSAIQSTVVDSSEMKPLLIDEGRLDIFILHVQSPALA